MGRAADHRGRIDRRDVLGRRNVDVAERMPGPLLEYRLGPPGDTGVGQGEAGVHAAVVELDALANAVRSAAENNDLAPRARLGLALLFVRGVHVGGGGREFRRTGVDTLVHRADAQVVALVTHGLLGHVDELREARIGEALALQHPQPRGREARQPLGAHLALLAYQILDLREEPRIDVRQFGQLLRRPAALERPEQRPHPPVVRHDELLPQRGVVFVVAIYMLYRNAMAFGIG